MVVRWHNALMRPNTYYVLQHVIVNITFTELFAITRTEYLLMTLCLTEEKHLISQRQ